MRQPESSSAQSAPRVLPGEENRCVASRMFEKGAQMEETERQRWRRRQHKRCETMRSTTSRRGGGGKPMRQAGGCGDEAATFETEQDGACVQLDHLLETNDVDVGQACHTTPQSSSQPGSISVRKYCQGRQPTRRATCRASQTQRAVPATAAQRASVTVSR